MKGVSYGRLVWTTIRRSGGEFRDDEGRFIQLNYFCLNYDSESLLIERDTVEGEELGDVRTPIRLINCSPLLIVFRARVILGVPGSTGGKEISSRRLLGESLVDKVRAP